MKRAQALRQLSRDHHKALFVAQRLRRAKETDCEARATEFLDFWREHGHRHFQVEEELLLPAYERVASAEEEPVVRVLTDHVTIRRRAADIEAGQRTVGFATGARHDSGRARSPRRACALPAHRASIGALADLEGLARAIARAEREGH